MKVLVCQTSIGLTKNREDISNNVDRHINLIRSNVNEETGLIILPELSTISYSNDTFEILDMLSEDLFGPTFKKYSSVAEELSSYILYGIPRHENSNFYISQVVINSSGQYVDHYDKLHIAQFGDSSEKNYFSKGNKICVFDIGKLKFGLIICYDIRFPALTSILRKKHEVDVILHPSAFAKDTSFYSWHSFVITRALENICYFISVNRAGENWGNSIICPPWVDENIKPEIFNEREIFKTVEIDKNIICRKREEFPFHNDEQNIY